MQIQKIDKENVNLRLSIQELRRISDAFATHHYQRNGGEDSKDLENQIKHYLFNQYMEDHGRYTDVSLCQIL